MNETIFRIIVYGIGCYFISIKNIYIKFVGLIIILAHLYKDITNLEKWPFWCEIIGLILSSILIINSIYIKNYFILFIGMLKFLAHIRQIIYNDNKYYNY